MADGDEVVIPYQPGKGPDASAATATAAPDTGAALATTSPSVPSRLPEQPIQNMTDPEAALKFESWGSKVYHGILNALGGAYSTQFIPTPNGVIQNQVKNTPGQQWKNIISGALSGFSSAAQAQGTGPGSTMRAAGAGVAGGYKQRVGQDEDQREAALKIATSNAQTALMSHQLAESTWRLANSQRQASDEIITGANTFNQLVSAGGPGSTDLGTMTWQDAQKAAKEWPQLHHEQANGRIITMQDVDPEGKTTGKVRAAWVTNDWLNAKTTQDYQFTVPLPGKDGKTEYQTVNIPAGAYTQGDMSKLIMAQGSAWGQQMLEQARVDEEKRRTEQAGRLIPSEIAEKQGAAAKDNAEAAAARAKANGADDVDWGPGGAKGFNSWHDKNVTPALQSERLYNLSSNIYNEYQQYRQQGKAFPTGAQSVQMLSNHIAGTFGNVKGARITKDLIEKHLGARGISDSALTAVQRITNGDVLSPEQWDAFFSMIGETRKETWRGVLNDAQALGRPTDYIAFPADLRQQWGLGPGHVPGATGMMPGETAARPAAQPQAPGAAAGAGQPPAGMVTVQIPGQAPGHIPAAALEQFKRDHPNATVPQ